MQCVLLMIGKTRVPALVQLEADYTSRINHYMRFDREIIDRVKDIRGGKLEEDISGKEGECILKRLHKDDYVVLLDERGKEMTSPDFAHWLEQCNMRGTRRLVFVIGGAFGFSQEVYARADYMLALSRMTFAHEMVRVIFEEQLYRACTIIRGEGYHH